MNRILYLFLLLGFTGLHAQQQINRCGTPASDEMIDRLIENKRNLHSYSAADRNVDYIPVVYHLIADQQGNGRASMDNILDMHCMLNEDFADAGLQFYVQEYKETNNNAIYNGAYNQNTASGIMQVKKEDGAVNIWVTNSANDPSSGQGTTLAFYHPFYDWIVINKSYASGNDNTISHEMGHFFSLPHPFLGWENCDTPGNNQTAPSQTCNNNLVELQNGSNCETAGDMICDTAPDYNFGFGASGCEFTQTVYDPNGDVVDPDELLHMGYFLNCSLEDYYFTNDQQGIMVADFNSPFRAYLQSNFTPTIISSAPVLLSPADDQQDLPFNAVQLEWESVSGANTYLLEIDPVANLNSFFLQQFIVSGNSKVLTTLDANKTYHWRVRPMNSYQTCTDLQSETFSFRTNSTTANNNIEELNEWNVRPNPVSPGADLIVDIEAATGFSGLVKLTDITGREVLSRELRVQTGQQQLSLTTDQLQTGLYLVTLQTDDAVMTRRVVVR